MASTPASSQTLPDGVEQIRIPVGDMVFDALAAGAADGELVLLLHGFPQFRAILGQFSMSEADVETYLGILGTEEALGAALNWYRAGTGSSSAASPPPATVTVPTLYVWSTDDTAFARSTAEASAEFVTGPYRFEILEGTSPWIPEEAPERLSELLVEHLQEWRGR